jgi:hypothetical protein
MPDVTEATAEVGQMIVRALQNTLGLGPEAALAQAQAEVGISDTTLESADMGDALTYACGQPGLSPEIQQYLTSASANYNSYGNVSQSGSSYTGGGGGYSGGGSSNAQIVQQVTQNYNYQEINDNHIDILGPVDGDIDIDQDNDDVDVSGDGNAVNTGDGDQNAATGDGSSAAQSEYGDAVSNSGDGAVTAGDDVYLDNSAVGDGNTIIDNEDGNLASGDGSTILDNEDGTIDDSSLGFGDGNVQGDVYNEEGAANSQGGDAQGTSVDLNLGSDVDEEHGPGDNNDGDSSYDDGGTVLQPLDAQVADDGGHDYDQHDSYDAQPEHLAEPVEVPEPEHHEAPMDDDALDS